MFLLFNQKKILPQNFFWRVLDLGQSTLVRQGNHFLTTRFVSNKKYKINFMERDNCFLLSLAFYVSSCVLRIVPELEEEDHI